MKTPSRKMLAVIVLSVFVLGAWTPFNGKKQEMDQVLNQVISNVDKNNWSQAQSEARHFTDVYQNHKWVLQLMGDEKEYEAINQSMNKLQAAIKTKNKTQSNVEVATIKSLLNEIFGL